MTTMIGLGYYGTHTPQVVLRKVLENPAWYTAYTPYQPEISQGRLEALLNYQTMVCDLTGLPRRERLAARRGDGRGGGDDGRPARVEGRRRSRFVVDADVFPQTLATLQTRAEPLGIEIVVADLADGPARGRLLRRAGCSTRVPAASCATSTPLVEARARRGRARVRRRRPARARAAQAARGRWAPTSSSARRSASACPIGFGGPHAAYMSVRSGLERALPGRLVGVSVDADGNPALRLALQTREQHIRREKATSNICTAQVLLAVMASMYAVYHGREGLELIARRVHRLHGDPRARACATAASSSCTTRSSTPSACACPYHADAVIAAARQLGINLLRVDADTVGIACDEVTERPQVERLWSAFRVTADIDALDARHADAIPAALAAHVATSSRTRSSASTAPRRRCCATCARSRAATSRSTAR